MTSLTDEDAVYLTESVVQGHHVEKTLQGVFFS